MSARLALAVLLPIVACAVQWYLWDIFKPYAWFFFIPTVFLSAWIGGLNGGLAATVIGALLAWYFFISPTLSFHLINPVSAFSIIVFVLTGCLFSVFFDQLRRSKKQANDALAIAESANEKISDLYQKLKEAQRLASVGNWSWDIQCDKHTWSEEVYNILDRDPALHAIAYPDVQEYFTPESWSELSVAVERCLSEGVSYECDVEVVRPSNCPRRWIAASGEAIRDANGNIVNLHGTVQDISERKRVEQSLRESEEQLAVIINSAMDGVIAVDEQQRIRLFNPAATEMFGLSMVEAIGQPLSRLLPERFHQAHEKAIVNFAHTSLKARRMGGMGENSGIRANGQEFPIEASISQSVIAGKKLFIAIVRDITERKQTQDEILRLNFDLERRVVERTAELTAANRELDSFAYAVAHDLRAPLRAMSGFSHALQEDYGHQLQGEPLIYLEQISLASRKMSDLVDGLLLLSRSTRGGLQYELVDISAMSKRLLAELAQSDHGQHAMVEVEAGLQAQCDARMLEVVMRNLLGNAWKYTSHVENPTIRVYAENRDNAHFFCVADNGAGFDMAHANRLFKPFQRLHRQDEFPGIGIGLATVRRIVNRHAGSIEARGEPGKGATFCFTLSDMPVTLEQDT
ncbi:PAS domain-containing sensor histidine kinase [Candidatus Nitrotoga sp. M5]|uniref:PAS domain-containing sensor histidine kinase n=1 Tax=Candidatus Nitrotoga sp. M5 TaxID=2890409 RepID=UPI001EF71B96|nr:PAS domain-containing sensor histidine kinase [Candidatus Nitrotoga sp. M5]CAH1388039.1 Histidine kinase [Candidatus Nitrotoga sp. M5]